MGKPFRLQPQPRPSARAREVAPTSRTHKGSSTAPLPTSGPLADELARIDEAIRELGGDPEEPPAASPDEEADILEALARLTLGFSDTQELSVKNLKALADRLGYSQAQASRTVATVVRRSTPRLSWTVKRPLVWLPELRMPRRLGSAFRGLQSVFPPRSQ